MPKKQALIEPVAEPPEITLTGRYVVTIHYLDMMGAHKSAVRYFGDPIKMEYGIAEYVRNGMTIFGSGLVYVIPPHMIQAITYVDQQEAQRGT